MLGKIKNIHAGTKDSGRQVHHWGSTTLFSQSAVIVASLTKITAFTIRVHLPRLWFVVQCRSQCFACNEETRGRLVLNKRGPLSRLQESSVQQEVSTSRLWVRSGASASKPAESVHRISPKPIRSFLLWNRKPPLELLRRLVWDDG